MKTNCIIVDDEPLSIELIKSYLDLFKDFTIVGEAYNAIEALDLLNKIKPQLMFLDINLPDISGIDLIKSLINPPKIILISGLPNYAIEAYNYGVIDYILKPYSIDRFIKALNKYNYSINGKVEYNNPLPQAQHFNLKVNNKTYNLNLDKILYFESMREFVKIQYVDETKLIIKYVLSKLEESLPDDFIRVHKSYIVSKDKIKSFTNKYIEVGEKRVPIGPLYKIKVLTVLSGSIHK